MLMLAPKGLPWISRGPGWSGRAPAVALAAWGGREPLPCLAAQGARSSAALLALPRPPIPSRGAARLDFPMRISVPKGLPWMTRSSLPSRTLSNSSPLSPALLPAAADAKRGDSRLP
ncbi:unnamed protein product [Heterosigma akashiwo]